MYSSIGCCASDIAALAYAADQHPRWTKEGQRARARLALALVERRAASQGNLDLVRRARRGLGTLGTASGSTSNVVEGMRSRAIAAARRLAPQVEQYFALARGAVALVRGLSELSGPDMDRDRVFAWIGWVLGGPLPYDVAENDVRILKAVFAFQPALSFAIADGLPLAQPNMSVDARTALRIIANTYLPALKRSVDEAYAALPPVGGSGSGAPPPELPLLPPAPPPEQQRAAVMNMAQRIATMTPTQRMALLQTTRQLLPVRPSDVVVPQSSNLLLVALPAAALVWYFIK
jgi:hypothetical protein